MRMKMALFAAAMAVAVSSHSVFAKMGELCIKNDSTKYDIGTGLNKINCHYRKVADWGPWEQINLLKNGGFHCAKTSCNPFDDSLPFDFSILSLGLTPQRILFDVTLKDTDGWKLQVTDGRDLRNSGWCLKKEITKDPSVSNEDRWTLRIKDC